VRRDAPRVLFVVEGFTDIRFVVGLSEVCDLTMLVPAGAYAGSGLKDRVRASRARVSVDEIPGGRLAYQARSLAYLWRHARRFDVILSQELLRGSLSATVTGVLLGVPVVTTLAVSPVEYFRCRRERRQLGPLAALVGESAIRVLMAVNGRLATACLALGPYLHDVAARTCRRVEKGYYYGVDVEVFRPLTAEARRRLRGDLQVPRDTFLIVLASRVSHEKDPETVLRAAALARARGLNATILNLSGGYEAFLALAASLGIPDASTWVLGRAAVHPMFELADYLATADVVAQGSLAEGLGLSPLEALACETPVVATRVGGMAAHLADFATLTPRGDAEAMAQAFLDVASDPVGARERARRGRAYVCQEWSRAKAFAEFRRVLDEVAGRPDISRVPEAA
jgi:glycosyltransferase involved in cell wall biosynthesis